MFEKRFVYGIAALVLGYGALTVQAENAADYRAAAETGDAEAQFNLGWCYRKGRGVAKNLPESVKWYRKAAEQGHAKAQNMLGLCYRRGIGVPKDYQQAVYWYRKAAEQGDANAQSNLGRCYEYGYGVGPDKAKAVYWYRKAAEQGNFIAKRRLTKLQSNTPNVHSEERTSAAKTDEKDGDTIGNNKSQTSVDNTKKHDYLGNMGFETLITTLSDFRDCSCADCRKRFHSFFEEKWNMDYSLSRQKHVCVPQCVDQQNLSYGQKKQILLQRYKDVIDYINELRNTPLSLLQDKYMNGVKYKEFGSDAVHIFSPMPQFPLPPSGCWWHTKFLAERGCTKAQLIMGFNHGFLGVDNSISWLKKAGLNGEAKACFLIAMVCIREGSSFDMYKGPVVTNAKLIKTAIDWLKRGSSMGDVDCMYELGSFATTYLHDGSVALQWFEPAAKMNHGDAIYQCAKIYSGGIGGSYFDLAVCKNVKPDYRRAVKYYEQLISMYGNDEKFEKTISNIKKIVEELKLKIED